VLDVVDGVARARAELFLYFLDAVRKVGKGGKTVGARYIGRTPDVKVGAADVKGDELGARIMSQ
jgi:hypothetical protein